ncbi:glycerophosphodiester phosphodiesterase family protein [Terricaulis sp.]|uniref:glycerophosphodiester phosphodiesterase family protein n=1 Tax=Terricaulis sp. TaxID=2768686 RepID=UPI003783657E
MKRRGIVLGAFALIAVALFLLNTSLLAKPTGQLSLLSHRGVHQDFSRENLDNDDCTATRIYPPTHSYIENTLPSMQAAFDAGADTVEIDIHPTTDGEFAVFHDWTLDCRTDGHGVTRGRTMSELRGLDVGYGYTADGGRTYPLRGQGVGMMRTLREVLAAFPAKKFLINFKGGEAGEADLLLAYLDATPDVNYARLAFYGAAPANRLHELRPALRTLSRHRLIACAKSYMLTGWFGRVAEPCRNTIVFVPHNYGWVAWGWPNRFLERMQNANTDVVIVDAIKRGETPGVGGVDDAASFAHVPRGWLGGVATDRIEVVGPLAAERRRP